METARYIRLVIVILVALALLGGVGYGIYLTIRAAITGFMMLETNVAGAIVAGSATVIVSVLIVAYNQRKIKKREFAESNRRRKILLYKRLIDVIAADLFGVAMNQSDESITDEFARKKFDDIYSKFYTDLVVWGSPSVIKTTFAVRASDNRHELILNFDEMLRAIRHDLGNSNWGLEQTPLFEPFLPGANRIRNRTTTKKSST